MAERTDESSRTETPLRSHEEGRERTESGLHLSKGVDSPDTGLVDSVRADEPDASSTEVIEIVTIRTEIEQTRHDISETLDALREKLSPQVLVEQAKEHVRDAAVDALDSARETVQENISSAVSGVQDTVGNIIHSATDTVESAVHNVTSTVGDVVESTKEHVSDLFGSAKESVQETVGSVVGDTRDHVQDAVNDVKGHVADAIDATRHTVSSATRKLPGRGEVSNLIGGAKSMGTSLVETAKRNPIPTAMIGLGAIYLYMKNHDENRGIDLSHYDYNDLELLDTPPVVDPSLGNGTDILDPSIETDIEAGVRRMERIRPYPDDTNVQGGSTQSGNPLSGVMTLLHDNPIPAALTLFGAGWLLFQGKKPDRPLRYGDYSEYGRGYTGTPHTIHNSGLHNSGLHNSGLHNSGLHNSGLHNSDLHNSDYGSTQRSASGAGSSVPSTHKSSPVESLVDGAKQTANQVGDSVGSAVHTAQEKVGDIAGTVKESVGDAVDATKSKVTDVASSVKEGVGGVVDATKSKVGDAVEGAKSTIGSAKETVVKIGSQARDQFGNLGSMATEQSRRAGATVVDTYHDNPMAYGLVALGVGAAVGLMLPGTEPENRLLGQKRDELVGQATNQVQGLAQKVQSVAGETLDIARSTAVEQAHQQGLA